MMEPEWVLAGIALASIGIAVYFRQQNRRLAAVLAAEKEQNFTQSCDMAEKAIALLELKESLEAEQALTAKLLRNLLPERVIAGLRDTGQIAPERFSAVTVFFSDIVDFTRLSAGLPPETVLSELSRLFSHFDRIFKANHCERIKTIGDAYLAVSGLPESDPEHCAHILQAATEAREFLKEYHRTHPEFCWKMRFGIHTGEVIGGIVGTEKYIYDIFGDTVNTAARMEQFSEPMKINVSEAVFRLAPPGYHFTPRPPAEVKGKGTMQMYFLGQ